MPTREDHLKRYTYKNEGFNLERRVFATLGGNNKAGEKNIDQQLSKIKRMQSLLFKKLVEREVIKKDEIDDFLLGVALGTDD